VLKCVTEKLVIHAACIAAQKDNGGNIIGAHSQAQSKVKYILAIYVNMPLASRPLNTGRE
jgi:hypothetical protein